MNAAAIPENAETIAVLEARLAGRASTMEQTLSLFSKLMDERQKNSDARMDRMEAMMAEIRVAIANLRMTILITAITSVIAVVLGIGGLNAALQANMIAAFQSGKDMAALQAEVRKQVEETAALLHKMQQHQDTDNRPDN